MGEKRCQGRVAHLGGFQLFCAFAEHVIERVIAEAVVPPMRVAALPHVERPFGLEVISAGAHWRREPVADPRLAGVVAHDGHERLDEPVDALPFRLARLPRTRDVHEPGDLLLHGERTTRRHGTLEQAAQI